MAVDITVYQSNRKEREHIFGMQNSDGEITIVNSSMPEWDDELTLHVSIEGAREPNVWWNGKKLHPVRGDD